MKEIKLLKKITSFIEKSIAFFNANLRKIIIYGIMGLLLFNFIFSDYGLVKIIKNHIAKNNLQTKIIKQEKLYDSLSSRIEKLKFDTLEIERISRETYGMVKQNENIYIYKEKKKDE